MFQWLFRCVGLRVVYSRQRRQDSPGQAVLCPAERVFRGHRRGKESLCGRPGTHGWVREERRKSLRIWRTGASPRWRVDALTDVGPPLYSLRRGGRVIKHDQERPRGSGGRRHHGVHHGAGAGRLRVQTPNPQKISPAHVAAGSTGWVWPRSRPRQHKAAAPGLFCTTQVFLAKQPSEDWARCSEMATLDLLKLFCR